MARRPYKKDLTPIGRRGQVDTRTGKGASEQRMYPGARETMTGGDPFARMANRYPKPTPADLAPAPEPEPMPAASPAPSLGGGGGAPTAMMPGGGGGEEEV
jgi:hypothetical protein